MLTFPSVALWAGVLVPVAYYGSQAIAAPFFPDFSFLKHTASLLGSELSTRPWVLNTGAAVTGSLALVASLGPVIALKPAGRTWLGVLLALCFASFGLASLWAASFPLPDQRHNPGPLGAGMFLAPFAACVAAFVLRMSTATRCYTSINILGFFAVAAAYSGSLAIDLQAYSGLLQRIGTVVMLVPLSVVCYCLLPRTAPTASARSAA